MRPRSQRDGGAMAKLISQNSVIVALMVLIIFGSLRYDHFLGLFNILTVLRYNSMFALISLGMCFVILSGGIDLEDNLFRAGFRRGFGFVCHVRTMPIFRRPPRKRFVLLPRNMAAMLCGRWISRDRRREKIAGRTRPARQ